MSALTKSLTGFGFGVALTLAATTSAQAAGAESCGTFTNAEGVEEQLACSTAPIDFSNKGSLQRGATMFMNYCASCHTAKYVRHSRIAQDLEIPPDHIDNGVDPDIQAGWFGAPPPDLSLETRLRSDDWVYTYLLSFYEDPSRPWGANNLVLQNAAMPHVLLNLQNELGEEEYRSRVGDLVNFMAWMAEPVREDRKRYGFFVMIFLLILLIPVYLLNKEFWKDVK